MKYKTFDWDYASKYISPQRLQFLKDNQDKTLSEEDFVREVKKIPRLPKTNRKNRTPHKLRKEYRNLKEKFGFFIPLPHKI